jgi:hypothetical protein
MLIDLDVFTIEDMIEFLKNPKEIQERIEEALILI